MLEPVAKETGSSEIDIPTAAAWGREKVKVIYIKESKMSLRGGAA